MLRSPQKALLAFDNTLSEITGPVFGHAMLGELDNDLIHNFARPGESAIGERIIVYGRVLDERGMGVPGVLLEFWQANAGGRYRHKKDGYLAPLDPNFGGCGRTITGDDGGYAFRTVKPGPYPWPNGPNDWRPSHIHFSVFGHGFAQRLITQMYFEGDPLIWQCPIVRAHPRQGGDRDADRRARHAGDDPDGRARLQVRHRAARAPLVAVREPAGGQLMAQSLDRLKESPSQTAGPYVHIGLTPNFCGIGGVYRERPRRDHGQRQDQGRAHRPSHPRARRHRHAAQGCADRDLAGGCEPGSTIRRPRLRGAADPNFLGWGRKADRHGDRRMCMFETIKPGRVPFRDGRLMAPHISLWIVARGINIGLHTRLYFSDEEEANAEDPILARIEHRVRVPTLIAARNGDTYVFDIHLQGEKETVFFDS